MMNRQNLKKYQSKYSDKDTPEQLCDRVKQTINQIGVTTSVVDYGAANKMIAFAAIAVIISIIWDNFCSYYNL